MFSLGKKFWEIEILKTETTFIISQTVIQPSQISRNLRTIFESENLRIFLRPKFLRNF